MFLEDADHPLLLIAVCSRSKRCTIYHHHCVLLCKCIVDIQSPWESRLMYELYCHFTESP